LIEEFEDVGMGFFDFIEKDNRIRAAPNGLGKDSAFAVSNVSGGEPFRVETVCPSWNSDMLIVMRLRSPP